MEWLETVGVFLVGILVRFGLPIGITALLVWWFRQLDQRWQSEAELQRARVEVKNPGCWEINRCAEESRARCRAYANPDKPCWQVFRGTDGHLQERCLGCDVFRKAPVPIPV